MRGDMGDFFTKLIEQVKNILGKIESSIYLENAGAGRLDTESQDTVSFILGV